MVELNLFGTYADKIRDEKRADVNSIVENEYAANSLQQQPLEQVKQTSTDEQKDSIKPEITKPEPVYYESINPETIKPEPSNQGPPNKEPVKIEPVKPEPINTGLVDIKPIKPESRESVELNQGEKKPEPEKRDQDTSLDRFEEEDKRQQPQTEHAPQEVPTSYAKSSDSAPLITDSVDKDPDKGAVIDLAPVLDKMDKIISKTDEFMLSMMAAMQRVEASVDNLNRSLSEDTDTPIDDASTGGQM